MTIIAKNTDIHFPIEVVWGKIRDFNALPMNHPAVSDCRIEDNSPSDHVGCIRCFNLKQGGTFREKLVTLDDTQHICTYEILESPIRVKNYIATIRLTPIEESNFTHMEWSAHFDCDLKNEAELQTWVGEVFEDGFRCLKQLLLVKP